MSYQLHCDDCGKALGTYLYGKGGIEEQAIIGSSKGLTQSQIPDIICFECIKSDEGKMTNKFLHSHS